MILTGCSCNVVTVLVWWQTHKWQWNTKTGRVLLGKHILLHKLSITLKLLNNGHPFCRGLVAVVDKCPLIRGCGKMSTNPWVWRGQSRLTYTKSVPRSFRPTKKCTDLQYRAYQWYISSCISSRPPLSFIS